MLLNVQLSALTLPFHILLMWQSSLWVRVPLSIVIPLTREIQFLWLLHLWRSYNSSGLCQWLHLRQSGCPFWVDGWAVHFLLLKATRYCKQEKGGDQRSPISRGARKGRSCSIRARSQQDWTSQAVWRSFSERISFFFSPLLHAALLLITLSWRNIWLHKSAQQTSLAFFFAPLTFAFFIKVKGCSEVPNARSSAGSVRGGDDHGSGRGKRTTNCWCKQTDTSPR